jgi:Ni/Co efflux regulator RcnB
MRKLLISILLASAAASPAIAGPRDSDDRQQARQERQEARQQQQQQQQQAREQVRADRSAAMQQRQDFSARQQFNGGERQQQFSGGERQQFAARPQFNDNYQQQVDINAMRAEREAQRNALTAQRDQRMQQIREQVQLQRQQQQDARDFRQSNRPMPQVMRDRHPLEVSNSPRFGTQPPLRADAEQRLQSMHWNQNWRNDGRYDWRRYRDHHRSRFHLSFYIDPFGWGYQPFYIGYRMWPSFYGNQYWIDPALYGLPYPPPGAAWVRYYNDVLLIDLYSGTVLDVIPGFFW